MVLINKKEKDVISERFPKVHITRTMKQKSKRHHYYCEEAKPVMRLLRQMRQGGTYAEGKAGGNNRFTEKAE